VGVRFVTILFLTGCGFSAVHNVTAEDMAGVDLAGADFALAPGTDLAGTSGQDLSTGGCNTCNCGQPALLVAVANVNGAISNGGRILQLGLGSGGAPTMCKTLTANKTLPDQPDSLGWFPPDGVIFGYDEGVILLDAVKDLQRWTFQNNVAFPTRSVFPLQKDANTQVVAAGFDTTGFDDITQLDILDAKNGTKLFSWDITDAQNSPIYLGTEVPAMVQSPLDPGHIFFIDNGFTMASDFPAGDVAVPFDNMPVAKPTVYWAMRPAGNYLTTINVVKHAAGGLIRTAWLQHVSGSSTADGVFFANDDGTGPTFTGPLTCSLAACAQPFKASDAVPDPTSTNAVITTCNSPTSNLSHVVRIDDSGTCTIVVDGNSLPNLSYPVALSIAEAR
jgi:hypothetical protein